MDFQFPFSLTTTLLFFAFIFLAVKQFKKSKAHKKLPPGPWKLPIIGNLHQFASGQTHLTMRDMAKKYGPLMHLKLGEVSAVVVSSPEVAKEVLRTHDLVFSERWDFLSTSVIFYDKADIVFAPYGDYWRQVRKICILELLSNKNVRSFRSIREDEVRRLISSVQKSALNGPVNVSEKVFTMTSSITCRAAFGKVFNDHEDMIQLIKDLINVFGGFNVIDLFPSMKFLHAISGKKAELMKMRDKLDNVLERIINEHVENRTRTGKGNLESGEEDLVDVLLRLKESGGMDFPVATKTIKALVLDMFSGGTETSSKAVTWAMSELMRYPRVMKKVQEEVRQALKGKETICEADIQGLSYLKLVVKESLRLHPAILPRECREEVEINGYTIPAKTKVFLNLHEISRDPNHWKDPDTFEPERFENSSIDYMGTHYEYIPFGAGRRICPGLSFGIANTELPLAQLLYHFNWELPNGMKPEELDMSETPGSGSNRATELMLIANPYDPSSDE